VICKESFTLVEERRQRTDDRRQTTE